MVVVILYYCIYYDYNIIIMGVWGLEDIDQRYKGYFQILYSLKRDDIDVHITNGAYMYLAHTQVELRRNVKGEMTLSDIL